MTGVSFATPSGPARKTTVPAARESTASCGTETPSRRSNTTRKSAIAPGAALADPATRALISNTRRRSSIAGDFAATTALTASPPFARTSTAVSPGTISAKWRAGRNASAFSSAVPFTFTTGVPGPTISPGSLRRAETTPSHGARSVASESCRSAIESCASACETCWRARSSEASATAASASAVSRAVSARSRSLSETRPSAWRRTKRSASRTALRATAPALATLASATATCARAVAAASRAMTTWLETVAGSTSKSTVSPAFTLSPRSTRTRSSGPGMRAETTAESTDSSVPCTVVARSNTAFVAASVRTGSGSSARVGSFSPDCCAQPARRRVKSEE